MKIAQISDIHFFVNDLSLKTFFSKTLLATLNYLFNRQKNKVEFDLYEIPKLLKEKGVTHIIFSGDFTTTANEKELKEAKRFLEFIHSEGFKTIIIPGNHDNYTKESHRTKRFYSYIETPKELEEDGIYLGNLGEGFQYILLDTTIATPLWSSQGYFSEELEQKLLKLLDTIPKEQPLILMNHFPIETRKHMPYRHQMVRYEKLKDIVKSHPNIKIYLFGHTHLSEIIEMPPLLLNSGSLTLTKGGSFHIMDLKKDSVEVEVHSHSSGAWKISEKKKVLLS